MLPEIIPVNIPNIDWKIYLTSCKQVLGRSVAQELDNRKLDVETVSSFVVTLGSIRNANINPSEILNQPGDLLKHLFYSFLVIADDDTYFDLLQLNTISVVATDTIYKGMKLFLASGTLEQWLLLLTYKHNTLYGRLIIDKIIMYFERIGLEKIFTKYRKVMCGDTTFLLELKQ